MSVEPEAHPEGGILNDDDCHSVSTETVQCSQPEPSSSSDHIRDSVQRDPGSSRSRSKEDASAPSSEIEGSIDAGTMDTTLPYWKGWAELENDPLIFTSLLHSLGVQDVHVSEVIPLDSILDEDPSSVLGLIFLSKLAASDTADQAVDTVDGLWFANQISTYSCATLALMNIINNSENINLGDELAAFKSSTASMTPKERGMKLDDYQFVKDAHNSFSRLLDRMNVDLRLKEEAQASARKRRKSRRKFTKRKNRMTDDEEDESTYHFVAYVPAQNHIWRLDGLDAYPRGLGSIEEGSNWLFSIVADLQTQLDMGETDSMEYSLLSINHKPGIVLSTEEQTTVARLKEDWSPFIAHMLKLHADKGNLDELLDMCS